MSVENVDAKTILAENIFGTVATANEDGSPWATPLHIFYDDTSIFWFSYDKAQHSLNIKREPRVNVVVFSTDESQGPKGAYFIGKAVELDEVANTRAKDLARVRLGSLPPVFEHAAGYSMPIGEFNRGKSKDNCWYFYS